MRTVKMALNAINKIIPRAGDFIALATVLYLIVFLLLAGVNFSLPVFAETENLKSETKNDTDKSKAKDTDKSKTKKGKKARTALDYMSSDDTVPGYVASIDPNIHYRKAQELANEKKYNAALKEVNAALVQNPKFYEARYLGALLYQWQGRKDDAVAKYRSLLLEKPDYLQARIGLASVLKELGHNKASEAEFRKATETNFSSVEAHYNLANLLIKENRFKEAVSELRICVKLAPTNAAVHNNLGVIFFNEHYLEEAEKEFKQASELDPANKTFLHNLESVRTAGKPPPALG